MSLPRREFLWALGLTAAMLLLFLYWGEAQASGDKCFHCTINNITEITEEITYVENTFIEDSGISGSTYNAALSQLLAMDAIHCSTSTRKNQAGIGTGYSDGKNGFAAGYCKTFVTEGGTPWMLGGKAAVANDTKPRYNLGVNWTF